MCGKIKFITFKNPLSALASEVTIASGLNPLMLTRATNAPTISTAVPIPVILLRNHDFYRVGKVHKYNGNNSAVSKRNNGNGKYADY